jgi:FkbM family methyltransferase
MGLKRILANLAEELTGTRIMLPGQVGLVFEEEHLKRFFSCFRIDCVFDVGANEGQYADVLRDRVGYRGPIISFEPIPNIAARLRSRAATTSNWFIEEAALDSAIRPRSFNIMANNKFSSLLNPTSADSVLFKESNSITRTIDITTSTLAAYYQEYKRMLGFSRPYLKMDTQGNDVGVAKGAGDFIREFAGLQSELAIRKLYDGSDNFQDALAYYRSNGFELSAFVPNNAGHFPLLVEIDCIMYRPDLYR